MCKLWVCVCALVAAIASSADNLATTRAVSADETRLLQGEIDRLAAAGGGTLRVRSGVHRSGALFFKPGVNLHLEKGAVILGVDDDAAYPWCETRMIGTTLNYYPALINADRCDGFTITGEGVIDGHGLPVWKAFWPRHRAAFAKKKPWDDVFNGLTRPRVLYVSNSRNVDVSGVTFKNSKFWTTHYYRCENVTVHDCRIVAEKLNGVKIDCRLKYDCQNEPWLTLKDYVEENNTINAKNIGNHGCTRNAQRDPLKREAR